jgi:murein DD-endopeptidase MepM/ murein hydrolase activator NlpD
MMRWGAGARTAWIDTAAAERRGVSMVWPVAGRVSSGFGLRYHPILHFARMHRGVDFAAGWGQPVLAATDGIVSRAGWAGGYGQQVRIAHVGDLVTSYSHLGGLTVAPGRVVHTGQLIGYVGSTGLSTGPHLHYEVYRGGVAVNPLSVRFAAPSPLAPAELGRFRARLGQLMAIRAVTPRG